MTLDFQNQPLQITATCLPGLEDLLAEELRQLGAENIDKTRRAVLCTGSIELVYRLNIYCRMALRILVHLSKEKVRDEQDMYRAVHAIGWHTYFSPEKSFAIRAAFGRHKFKNTHFFALKAKDAVVDRFMKMMGKRPSVDTKMPEVGIHLFYDSGELDIYLDSSGYSLHKRGYKKFLGRASINETLAAAVFQWAGWEEGKPVVNPMCGVGTMAIEAAMAMQGMSPQGQRSQFGFMHWFHFNQSLFDEIKNQKHKEIEADVLCSDLDRRTVDECRQNITSANMDNFIHCDMEDFFEMDPIENSILLLNPPYDKRLRESDVVAFYKKIGDTLKFKWKNCRAVIISGNLDAFKFIGLRPNKRYKVFNGPIQAEVRMYEIY